MPVTKFQINKVRWNQSCNRRTKIFIFRSTKTI